MRRVSSILAAVVAATCMVSVPARAESSGHSPAVSSEQYLFTVEATAGVTQSLKVRGPEDERFRLTLSGVDPVTQFSDRPFRDARFISPRALTANWPAFFAGDPPNAVLTYDRPGRAPSSMVVTLSNPRYRASDRTLSFEAIREKRAHDPVEKGPSWQRLTTPKSLSVVSLFIDDASSASDTTPPKVSGWTMDPITGCSVDVTFIVSDEDSGVLGVGQLGRAAGNYLVEQGSPKLVSTQGTSSVYEVSVQTQQCIGTSTLLLSYATDRAGNTVTNIVGPVIQWGIV
jgi:hypothetical protein